MHVHVCTCICDVSGTGLMAKFLEEHVSVPRFEHRTGVITEGRVSSLLPSFPQSVHERDFSHSGG